MYLVIVNNHVIPFESLKDAEKEAKRTVKPNTEGIRKKAKMVKINKKGEGEIIAFY